MKSPFPGMDPYLETRWGNVHSSLVIYASDFLNRALPSSLFARSEERTIDCDPKSTGRDIYPDVSMIESGVILGREASEPSNGGVAMATEVAETLCLIRPLPPEFKQRYLEIRDARSGGKVITVIEFVSPSNKRAGDGLQKYLAKQQECEDGNVNLVEIDLTRGGDRSLIMPVGELPIENRSTYAASVHLAGQRDRVWLYKLPITKRLGGIPIPLRKSEPPITLDLQSLIDQIYANGRYNIDLNYQETLHPGFTADELAWAEQLVTNRS